jgi:tetratricopeptide (TPR) repeat protein
MLERPRAVNSGPAPLPSASDWPSWLFAAAAAAITFLVFLPVLQAGFLNWDDDKNIVANPYFRGLGAVQLRWMFTTFWGGPYQPLSWLSLGLDYVLWGLNPAGYHFTNLLLHAANAALFYAVALRLLRAGRGQAKESALRWGAFFSALFFAIHPLRVESVAWITERRDVLSGFFYLLTLLFYLEAAVPEAAAGTRTRRRLLAIFFFSAALLSKAIGMGLPLALLVLDAYPLRRWTSPRRVLSEKLPYLLPALAAAIVAFAGQSRPGVVNAAESLGAIQRGAEVLYGLFFYLWKTLAPFELLPFYETPHGMNPFAPRFVSAAVVTLGLSAYFIVARRRRPELLASWAWYGLWLAPVLGIFSLGPQLVACRYSYLACAGWAVLGGGLVSRAAEARAKSLWIIPVVAGLGWLSWRQAGIWHDPLTLWSYEVARAPDTALAHMDLADALQNAGRLTEAAAEYQEAVRLRPDYAKAQYNLGNVYYHARRLDDARTCFEAAIRLLPGFYLAHNNLGNVLQDEGELNDAIEQYQETLRLEPDYAEAYVNMGNAFARQGQNARARQAYESAIRLKPGLVAAHQNLALILLRR